MIAIDRRYSRFLFFFFLMIRRPPRSTLFPTRRSSDLDGALRPRRLGHEARFAQIGGGVRSEEHTSELQSHSDLVCRLLLEKKKNKRRRPGCCPCESWLVNTSTRGSNHCTLKNTRAQPC